jgi:lipopolysaccharide export system permease protein
MVSGAPHEPAALHFAVSDSGQSLYVGAVAVKTLHRYLLRQVAASLVMTMLVFTFVLLVGSALRELLPLLVNGQASVLLVIKAFGLLIPFVFSFALPMAMLTSTVLVFERFSGDQELTAARASGVSLISLAAPILVLSLFLCGVSAVINMQIAPSCRVGYNALRSDMRRMLANFRLPEGYTDLPATKPGDPMYTIYTRKNRNQNLQDVMVYDVESDAKKRTVMAPTGHYEVDITNQLLILYLTNANTYMSPEDISFFSAEPKFVVKLAPDNKSGVSISDMTFNQLQDELRKRSISPAIPLSTVTNAANADPAKKKKIQQRTMTDFTEPIRIQIHKQIAFSFACFGFTLIGIPLGIRVHRRETKVGIFIALGLVAVYYAIMVVGQSLSSHAQYAPHLLMWIPNLMFEAVGAVLLWRANRGI